MAVHMKLYPVIYGLPLLLFAARNGGASSAFVFSATAALTAAAVCAGALLFSSFCCIPQLHTQSPVTLSSFPHACLRAGVVCAYAVC